MLRATEDWAFRRYLDMDPLWAVEEKPTKSRLDPIDPGGPPPNPEPAVGEGLNPNPLRGHVHRPDLPAWGHLQVSPHLGAKDGAEKAEYLLGTRPPGAYLWHPEKL
jgi:hypothetical protein